MSAKRMSPARIISRTSGFGQRALNAIRIFVRRDDLEGGLLLQRRNNCGRSGRVRLIYHRQRNAFRPAVFGVHAEDVSENVDEDERDDEGERDGHLIGREAPELIANQNQNGAHRSGVAKIFPGEMEEQIFQRRPANVEVAIGQAELFGSGEKFGKAQAIAQFK